MRFALIVPNDQSDYAIAREMERILSNPVIMKDMRLIASEELRYWMSNALRKEEQKDKASHKKNAGKRNAETR